MTFNRRVDPPTKVVAPLRDVTNDIKITNAVSIPRSALKLRFARSSGPGGQNVNKVSSKVELLFDPTQLIGATEELQEQLRLAVGHRLDRRGVLHIVADESRSQWANREQAVARLVDLLREAMHQRARRHATSPTKTSRERRAFTKVRRSRVKRLRGRISSDE